MGVRACDLSQVEGGSLGTGGGAAAAATTPEAELAARVNEMWFLEPGGEPLTFREVFLRSAALENIITGAQAPLQACPLLSCSGAGLPSRGITSNNTYYQLLCYRTASSGGVPL